MVWGWGFTADTGAADLATEASGGEGAGAAAAGAEGVTVGGASFGGRAPKMVEPTRTFVLPSGKCEFDTKQM